MMTFTYLLIALMVIIAITTVVVVNVLTKRGKREHQAALKKIDDRAAASLHKMKLKADEKAKREKEARPPF